VDDRSADGPGEHWAGEHTEAVAPDARRPAMIRLAALLVVVAALAVGAAVLGGTAVVDRLDDLSGLAGVVTYTAVYAIAVVLLVPGAALTIAAGALFGTLVGTTVSVVGAGVGAFGAYAIARHTGRSAVVRLLGSRSRRIDEWVAARQFRSMLVLRLLPILPFGPLNYSAGLSAIRPAPYAAATFLGIIPGGAVYANVGAAGREPTSLGFVVSIGLLVALTVVSSLLARRFRRPAEPPGPSGPSGPTEP
jgi:uncharacterized membrane protein YdjX (TVP38/TMEM64 family)